MTKQNDIVRLSTLVADLLELDEKEVKVKLEPLAQELIKIIASNKRFIIPGVLEIRPEYLEEGSYLNTRTNEYVDVPARISPRIKLQHRFTVAVKQIRLKLINYF